MSLLKSFYSLSCLPKKSKRTEKWTIWFTISTSSLEKSVVLNYVALSNQKRSGSTTQILFNIISKNIKYQRLESKGAFEQQDRNTDPLMPLLWLPNALMQFPWVTSFSCRRFSNGIVAGPLQTGPKISSEFPDVNLLIRISKWVFLSIALRSRRSKAPEKTGNCEKSQIGSIKNCGWFQL